MASHDQVNEDLNYEFDARASTYYQNQAWSIPIDQMESIAADVRRNVSPIQTDMTGLRQTTMPEHPMMDNWIFQQIQQQHQHQHQHHQHQHQHPHPHPHQHQRQQQQEQEQLQQQIQAHLEFEQPQHGLDMSYHPYDGMTLPQHMAMVATTQPTMTPSMPMDQTYVAMAGPLDTMSHAWAEGQLQAELIFSTTTDAGLAMSPYQHPTSSPTGSYLEVMSQPSSAEENAWIDRLSFEGFERPAIVDPKHTLHDYSQAVYSPTNLSDSDNENLHSCHGHIMSENYVMVARPTHPSDVLRAITIPTSSKSSSPDRSPASSGSASSPGRKIPLKKNNSVKMPDHRISKKSTGYDKSSEKRVGKRRGPLRPEQRKQASEIRKLGACLRCKFLKKTCDKGEPCSGCQPSHARLWQVPCTRIDIKEIGYFLKDRKFDYERHVSLGFSLANLMGFSDVETTLHITHGYGHMLPVKAREVFVRNDDCLKMDWSEANREINGEATGYEVATAKLSAGVEGIQPSELSEYLNRHIDVEGTFEKFIDDYFDGTPFLSDMLKVAHRFYLRTKSKIIKKALKLLLAYNLTLHITMVEGRPVEEKFAGKIEDETSKFYGKTMAPVMINFQIKVAMSDMWRELHKDVLEELSALYSSVYSGDKLKNWPTIFILASVLLAVWECMQFDCHYRVPDEASVNKFCTDMETTPVGVIVGLFSAISQKLPSILEWDTSKHHFLLGSNPEIWQTMTEVRDHVSFHETYLRSRPNAKFDNKDFDSLSNKFLSRLVLRDIRAN